MADNLKLIEERIDIEINPTGAPGSILAENHNGIEKEILRKTGKYTGSPFTAKKQLTVFPSGTLSWGGNAMNNVSSFILTTSKLTSDLTDFGRILNTLSLNDLIQFKDYKGRCIYLEYQFHTSGLDASMNEIYQITVKGFSENLNYIYQNNESEIAIISVIKNKGISGVYLYPYVSDSNEFELPQNVEIVTVHIDAGFREPISDWQQSGKLLTFLGSSSVGKSVVLFGVIK